MEVRRPATNESMNSSLAALVDPGCWPVTLSASCQTRVVSSTQPPRMRATYASATARVSESVVPSDPAPSYGSIRAWANRRPCGTYAAPRTVMNRRIASDRMIDSASSDPGRYAVAIALARAHRATSWAASRTLLTSSGRTNLLACGLEVAIRLASISKSRLVGGVSGS